jgi:dolichol-phosphate mannosyltransferase
LFEKGERHYPPVLVIVAALNEEEGIGPTIVDLRRYLGNPWVLVVDGKSCDGTAEIARAMGAEVICQEGKGKGDAIATAVRHINAGPDYVVFTDADYTYIKLRRKKTPV